ncbi:MAG TPA: DNA repair exonuclease [Dehalococcoidia bacterium]|nr:DNA repair exonuclease [Dehalococcoidia bacterium]
MPRPLRLIHTSDIHLDPYLGTDNDHWLERRELFRATFQRVLAATVEHEADILLISGDVFDSSRTRPETVAWFLEQCASIAPTPIVAINGNHDTLGDRSIYGRHDVHGVANLHYVLEREGRTILLEDLDLVIWGRGYDESDWNFRPLEGVPERRDDAWHVAMAHGHYERSEADAHRSMLIHPDEIHASQWDYLALGHWEAHEDVTVGSVTAVYSGAPMPISDANERAGLVMVVDLHPERGVSWRAENVDPRRNGG